jgi:hypothetical protein
MIAMKVFERNGHRCLEKVWTCSSLSVANGLRPAQLSLFSGINPIVTDYPHGGSGEKAANH